MDDNYGSEKGFLNGVKPCHVRSALLFRQDRERLNVRGHFLVKSSQKNPTFNPWFKILYVLTSLPPRLRVRFFLSCQSAAISFLWIRPFMAQFVRGWDVIPRALQLGYYETPTSGLESSKFSNVIRLSNLLHI